MKLKSPVAAPPATAGGFASVVVAAPAAAGAGGLGSAAGEIADGLRACGCTVRYVATPPPGRLVRLARSRASRRLLGGGASRRAVARSVRTAVPPDWDLAYAAPTTLPPGRGIRIVYQATRDPAVEWAALRRAERETGGRGDMTRRELARREGELEEADLVHVTSLAVREELVARGLPPDRLVHAYHGVDLERYRPAAKPERLTVAFVGPLSLRKGVDHAAELAQRLGGSAVVEAVGGPVCPWSRRVAASARFVPRPSVPETLAGAHALVLPSRSDGFSFVVLEALASGAVPLVTPEVGASELVQRLDPRLVVPQDGFAARAAALLAELDLEALGGRARALAEEFDRRRTAPAAATALLDRAARLGARLR